MSIPSVSIKQLNSNLLVLFENDEITLEKNKIDIMKNPYSAFLEVTNQASNIINQFSVERLLKNQPIVATIIDGNKQVINIYRNDKL